MSEPGANQAVRSEPGGIRIGLITLLAFVAVAFHMYAAGVSPFTALVQRPVHLAIMAPLGFLGLGVRRSSTPEHQGKVGRFISAALVVGSVISFLYLVTQHEALVRRTGAPTSLDLVLGVIGIVLVLELTRRTTGWGLVAVAGLALVYAAAGPWLPGALAHRGYGATRLVEHLYLSTEGIWGVPLGVSADFVYLFILFGAVLDVAGGGALLIGLANKIAGRTRGGPAKTAAIGSAFMGSLSGSAVANVVTTGTFTIPIMKRAGFRPFFAGAIEAAASTGGQLMPPVMGAGAFILATWTNIPYVEVAAAALIPALLYYVAVIMAIHFRASRMKLKPVEVEEADAILPRLHLLLPLVAIVVLLVMGRSPSRAAFWGVMSALVVWFLSRNRPTWAEMKRAAIGASRGTVQVAAACAAAGIVVGVASLTGIGLRMSELIVTVSGGQLPMALLLTAAGSIVLGMGLPTTAAYVVLAALGAPALVNLGVPLLAAHLFIFYFGCISNVTPPVSLAAYAAAGIADAPPLKTAVYGMALAGAGFLVPFMFVYGPPLLLVGSWTQIVLATVTACLGVTALAAATMGYARRPLPGWQRVLMAGVAVMLMMPGLATDLVGLAAMALVFAPVEDSAVQAV